MEPIAPVVFNVTDAAVKCIRYFRDISSLFSVLV